MMNALAVADLHGNALLYELLLRVADYWKIASVFIAGDLSPTLADPTSSNDWGDAACSGQGEFFTEVLIPLFESFLIDHRQTHIYAITGNDDRRCNESLLRDFDEATTNFHLVNDRLVLLDDAKRIRSFFPGDVPQLAVAGYPYVPLGGSLIMDWVKAEDRVRLVPPGMDPCMGIEQSGFCTTACASRTTIEDDLADFGGFLERAGRSEGGAYDPKTTIHLFHTPPYNTPLDRTGPQGHYDYVRRPEHIGSSAVRRFVERAQPYLVLCGHCHEAVVLGDYKATIGATPCINPGSQPHIDVLSVVQFDPYDPTEMKQFFINAR